MALWALLLCGALGALFLLNANALRLVNYIEYVKAGRFQRVMALYTEAEQHAKRVLEKANKLNMPSKKGQVLLSANDPDYRSAVDLYTRALALDPREPFSPDQRVAYEILGQMHDATGSSEATMCAYTAAFLCGRDLNNAKQYASTLTQNKPDSAEGWRLLAEANLALKDVQATSQSICSMEQAKAPACRVHELRARLWLNEGQTTSALAEYEAAVACSPNGLDLRKKLAQLQSNLGHEKQAAATLASGLASGGSYDANYLHHYGEILLRLGDNAQALKALESAVGIERNSSELWWTLARAYQRTGKTTKAQEAMQLAMQLNPKLRGQLLEKPIR